MRRRWCRGGAMDEFLLSAAAFVLLMVALGLVRVARGPGYADRMMAAQLLGTGGIGALLLVGAAVARSGGGRRGADAGAAGGLRLDRLRQVHGAQGPSARRRRGRRLMERLLDLFSIVAVVAGAFFFLAGSVGLLRFPDAYTRLHALTKADNLGLALVVIGLLPQMDGVLAGAEAGAGVAAGAAVQRGGVATDRARGAAPASEQPSKRHDRQRASSSLAHRAAACWRWPCGRCWCATPSWPSPASSPTACCCRWCGCGCTASTSR